MVPINKVTWLHIDKRDNFIVCERCGQRHNFDAILPLPIDCVLDLLKVFQKAHRYCRESQDGKEHDHREV